MNELARLKRIKEAMLSVRLSHLNNRDQKQDYDVALRDVQILIDERRAASVKEVQQRAMKANRPETVEGE
jgi:hypothetical protein